MKQILLSIISCCLLLAAPACKQDGKNGNAAKGDELLGTKEVARKAQEAEKGAADIFKSAVQGKWKPKNEPEGSEYRINDKIFQRYVNGNLDFSSTVEYGTTCGITCGGMSKKYRESVGCLTISGQANMCIVVSGFTTNRIDLVRLGDPNAQPETWEKIQ